MSEFNGKKVLVIGGGISAEGASFALEKLGASVTLYTDDSGEIFPDDNYDLVVISPGVSRKHYVYDWAKKENPDWTDFPALPIEVIDNGTGKFVTDFTYANNKLTISRSNVAWNDIADRPTIPTMPTVNDGTLTLKASTGLTATQQTFSANDADNITFEVKHGTKPTSGSAHAATAGSGRTYVTKVDVDSYGHIAKVYTATESDQDLSGYKTKQTAVSDPTANGNATEFIASITQNENGEITVTKKSIQASDLGLSGAMHFVGVKTTLPNSGNDGDVVLVGGKEYVWASNKWNELGDEGSHALKTINIASGDGLTGGGTLEANRTISHAVPSGASAGSTSPSAAQDPGYGATFNIPVITTDKFGHVTAKSTTTVKMPAAQDLSNYATATELSNAIKECKEDSSNKDVVVLEEIANHANDGGLHLNEVSAGTGLKATKTGASLNVDFDDEVVFIFYCGDSKTLI